MRKPLSAAVNTGTGQLRLAGAAALVVAFALSGCSPSEPETGTEIEDIHLDVIRDAVPDPKEYERVRVPGQVEQVLSPSTFSITDPDDPTVEELLIVDQSGSSDIEPGAPVRVTGIIYRGFDVAEVEKETDIVLDEALHLQWQGDSYLVASEVDPRQ